MIYHGFDWDVGNRHKNRLKHGITCTEAEECFADAPLIYADTLHSTTDELRFILLGKTSGAKKLFVAFTLRHDLVRIISARPMSQKERNFYETEKKKNL